MNIIIPSKKIYSKDYSNIVDNQAKSISITVNDVARETTQKSFAKERVSELDNVTFPKDNLPTQYNLTDPLYWSLEDIISQEDGAPERYITWCSTKPYYKTVQLKVKKAYVDGSTIPNSFSITSTKNAIRKTYTILGGDFVFATIGGTVTDRIIQSVSFNDLSGLISTESVTNIPLTYQSPVYNNSTYGITKTVTEPINYENFDEDHYLVRINILYAIGVITIGQALKYDYSTSNTKYNIEKGTLEEYQAYSIDFELLGNVYTLNTKDDTITLTSGSEHGTDIVLQSNNLMQGKYKEAFEENAQKTLEAYKNGKEIATIRCSIGEYYDTSGNKVISTQNTDKMTFNLYDRVIPMVRNKYGLDSPLSLSPEGRPKVFTVLGTEIFFDGAVWQKLHLQESGSLFIITSTDGNRGLSYILSDDNQYYISNGIGTETSNDIKIASYVNDIPVYEISESAFSGVNFIKKLTIPESIKTLGNNAFNDLRKLKELYFNAKEVQDLQEGSFVFGNMGVSSSSNGTDVFIGEKVTKIPNRLFSYCFYLKSLTFAKGSICNTIGESAFYNCKNLTNIVMPNAIRIINSNAFSQCERLTDIYFEGTELEWNNISIATGNDPIASANIYFYSETKPTTTGNFWYYENGIPKVWEREELAYTLSSDGTYYAVSGIGTVSGGDIVIPDSYKKLPVKEISARAFAGNNTITSVTIPNTITSIGKSAFNCENIKSVYISDISAWCNISFYDAMANPLYISLCDLYLNGNLVKTLEIPSTVQEIKQYAFAAPTRTITRAIISDGVKTINKEAFYSSNIQKVEISNTVTTIGESAFYACTSLKEIIMGNGVKTIDTNAFEDCFFIETVNYQGSELGWNSITINSGNTYLTNATIEFAIYEILKGIYLFNETITEPNYIVFPDVDESVDLEVPSCDFLTYLPDKDKYTYIYCKDLQITTIKSDDGLEDIPVLAYWTFEYTYGTYGTVPEQTLKAYNFGNNTWYEGSSLANAEADVRSTDNYRYIYFYENKIVNSDFYNWFNSNASFVQDA